MCDGKMQGEAAVATLDDMTGWQDELEELRPNSDQYRRLYSYQNMWNPREKIPIERIFLYSQTLLASPDLRHAITERYRFLARTDRVDDDPRFPHWATQPLLDFTVWFTLKTDTPPNDAGYVSVGWPFAGFVALAGFNDVRNKDAVAFLMRELPVDTFVEI
jgi:hypothetical protein